MFNQENNIMNPVKLLEAYLEVNQSGCRALRRRAVIHYSNSKLTLLMCTVEVITSDIKPIEVVASTYYPQALLFEDWLSDRELLEFVKQVGEGHFYLGEHSLEATNTDWKWTGRWVPRSNDYMLRAGHVLSTRFDIVNVNLYEPLQAPQQPYYPDLFEAVKDWLPIHVYHARDDSRRGEIILLLPETRAYLVDATRNDKTLDIRVAGTGLNKLSLELKGAWWDEEGIHQIEEKVSNGLAKLNIPVTAKRFEYVLVDSKGTKYDRQDESHRHPSNSPSASIGQAEPNNTSPSGEIPGRLPRTGIGKLAIKAAWEIECRTGKRAMANQVIQELQKLVETEPELIEVIPHGVKWTTTKGKDKNFDYETCAKTLSNWHLSRT